MANITLSVPEELHKRMAKNSDIKWSEVARRAFENRLNEIDLIENITNKSKLTMKDVNELKRQLKCHIDRYCNKDEVKIVCIGDGAKWIWKTCEELFPEDIYRSGIIEIVDFYHALEKIGDIKDEVFSDKEEGDKFYGMCKDFLRKGNIEVIEQVLQELRDKQNLEEKHEFVDERLKYFMNNKYLKKKNNNNKYFC